MDKQEMLQSIKRLSQSDIKALLGRIQEKPKKPKKVEKKSHATLQLRINDQRFTQTAKRGDIIKHFMETLVKDLKIMPPYAIKSQIVGIFEMLAEVEPYKKYRDEWRQKAARVMMFDSQEHLSAYVVNLATDIRV